MPDLGANATKTEETAKTPRRQDTKTPRRQDAKTPRRQDAKTPRVSKQPRPISSCLRGFVVTSSDLADLAAPGVLAVSVSLYYQPRGTLRLGSRPGKRSAEASR